MKKYIGTKIIHAEPMKAEDFKVHPLQVMEDCHDGYYVVYEDGYKSWSPKDVFEKAYRACDEMTFGLAIEAVKKGHKVARKGWNGKGQYIELAQNISYQNRCGEVVNCNHEAIGNKAIAFVGTSGVQMGWLASQADMLAEDWVIVG